jgi:hypothetical protein
MTEDDLKARGYPGGDAQLLGRFVQLFGRQPIFTVFEPPPDWKREILLSLINEEIAASHGKSERLGAAIGPWPKPPRGRRVRKSSGGR